MHKPKPLAPLALLAGLLLSACGSSHRGGTIIIPQGPDFFYEIEPNDSPFNPDFIQLVDPFTDTIIEGALDGGPPGLFDTYDHFAFTAAVPAEFSFELHSPGVDLAIGLYDPFLGEFVAWWDSPFDVEFGSFVVHSGNTDFQLVVHAPGIGGDYILDLFGFPYQFSPATLNPGMDGMQSPEREIPAISVDPFGTREDPKRVLDRPKDLSQA